MNWPEIVELSLEGIAQGGEGVGRWDDRVVFAGGGLPGERVRVHLRERHAAYARGEVVEVIEASLDRVPPRLPGVDSMPWQHIAYSAQLRFKRQILADQLAKIGGLADLAVEETQAAPRPWGYRNSARFHSDGQRVGYYAAESHRIQEIPADPLLLPALNEALGALRKVIHLGLAAPAEVIVRASEAYGYVLAALHPVQASVASAPTLRHLAARWRRSCPALAGVVLPATHLGADRLIEELGGIAFHLRPTTFFQVNVAAAEALVGLVRDDLALQAGERLLDLYCGAGTFTLPLAATAAEVVGIEEVASAVEDARTTAAENGIASAHFVAGRVEAALAQIEGSFDAAVLDPPRRGCHPHALDQLLRLTPRRIAYVSCHPATLARDLKRLVAGGYRVVRVRPVDLFPQTAHIESVCLLVRG